jgi:hypothetical protein
MEPASHPSTLAHDAAVKDALRIQAAAVAAQQAALGDEETRLEQRRAALEQQETQLAAHLEEKRRRLIQLHEEARQARGLLQEERTAFQETVAKTQQELAAGQKEIQQAQAERRRLVQLRRRLKKRWHRHWLAERRALSQEKKALEVERETLHQQRAVLEQESARLAEKRLHDNGEIELGKRQLHDQCQQLRQEQEAWNASRAREQSELKRRAKVLEAAEAALAQTQRDLAYDQHEWQGMRLLLQREAEGLDARIVNQRRLLAEQDNLVEMPLRAETPFGPCARPESETGQRSRHVSKVDLHNELQRLQRLAGDLADQRWQLVDQWERLAQTQARWQAERDAAAAELKALAARLAEHDPSLEAIERRREETTREIQRQHLELTHERHDLEAWHVRLRGREAAWEGERDRLLAEQRSREEAAEQLRLALTNLRDRWAARRKREQEQLRAERAATEKLRQEWMTLREQWYRRAAALEDQARALAEKELALERHRQQVLTLAPDAAAAERAIELLRRRLSRQNAAAARRHAQAQRKLHTELAQLKSGFASLHQQADALIEREIGLAEQETILEEQKTRDQSDQLQGEARMRRLRAQHDIYEQQILALQNEVERVALVLLHESAEPLPTLNRAA